MNALFRSRRWLCLAKPAGMVTVPPTSRGGRTLVDLARELAPDAKHHHPLSRLDADVTGAVLFALTDEALALAESDRAAGRWRRRYVALASAHPSPDEGAWTWPVAVDRRDRTRRTTGPGDDPQPAETRYVAVATAGGATMLRCEPVTGRTHQIRVHAKAAGCALLGDLAYGGPRRLTGGDGAVVSLARPMLHAWRVRVPGGTFVVEAPLPDDLRAVWTACGGADGVLDAWRAR